MSLTTFHFIRHAQVYNPNKVIYGRLPGFRISDMGHKQAEVMSDFLKARQNWISEFAEKTPIVSKTLYTSPLLRTKETAVPLLAKLGLDQKEDERIIESLSKCEGRPIPVNPFKLLPLVKNPFSPSWGESYEAILKRMLDFVEDVAEKEQGKQVLCVSHQSPIYVLRRHFEGKPLWHNPANRNTSNCSITSFTYNSETRAALSAPKYMDFCKRPL